MGSFVLLFLPLLAILATGSSPPGHHERAIAEVSNRLAVDFHKKLSVGDDNVFFSPLSISTALAMLFYGSRGKTSDEMRHALGYQQAGLSDNEVHSSFENLVETLTENTVPDEYSLYLASAVIIQQGYPILDEYISGLREIYKATARNVYFRKQTTNALQEINDWVKRKTNNQITELLSDLDPDTVMILLNAVYFKGKWETEFENTMDRTFFNKGLETERVKIPMMQYEKKVLYTRLESAQAIELPYKGEDISMVILLPDTLDGLPKLEENLTINTVKDIRRSVRKMRGVVTLPKFKLEFEKNLNSVLQDLGIKNVFNRGADLSGICDTCKLLVSEVVHKAVVEVNEEGTEASAATGIVITKYSMPIKQFRFFADHPFVFFIVDRRNDLVLFQGRVNKL